MPRALPTAMASSSAAFIISINGGCWRMTPIVERVAEVMPLQVPRRTNFTQSSTSMWGLRSATKPARRPASWNRSSRSERLAVPLAEHQPVGGGVPDVPGLVHDGHDVGDTTRHVIGAHVPGHHVDRLDAVLQRDHYGVWSDERRQPRRGALDVVELDA